LHNLVGGTSAKRSVEPTQLGLKPLNVSVWAKNNVGMGSLYRSQNELLPLLKKGTARHVNNIELGKRGRWRASLDSHACRGLKDHPTVKLTAILENALLDLSNRSDIVVDPFLGSGSTLIAADKTSLSVRGVELDPLYVHVIVRLTGARRAITIFGCPSPVVNRLRATRATHATVYNTFNAQEPRRISLEACASVSTRSACCAWIGPAHPEPRPRRRPRAIDRPCAHRFSDRPRPDARPHAAWDGVSAIPLQMIGPK
jgi:hypothetical protein